MLAIWAFKAPLIAAGAGAGLAALGYMFYKDRKSPDNTRTVTFSDDLTDSRPGSPRSQMSPELKSVVATPDVLAISQGDWDILTSHIK